MNKIDNHGKGTGSSTTAPQFITFEGIEGCGKSVQARKLADEFRHLGIPFVATREPGGTAFGNEVRQILLRKDGAPREAISELLLYLADRYQDLNEVIEPGLKSGRHVICDRYHDATLAYQGHARGIGFSTIGRIAAGLGLRRPDLTLVLDLDIPTGLSRARSRMAQGGEEVWGRFEAEEIRFHEKVREGYSILLSENPERMKLVDADGTPEQVFERIREILRSRGII